MGILRFRLFGFPVDVEPGFWILTLLFGTWGARSIQGALIWVGIVFLSVLVHELGHAFVARAFGQQPSIVLHMMGGLTAWRPTRDLGRLRQVLASLAGPFAGFGLGTLALAVLLLLGQGKALVDLTAGSSASTLTSTLGALAFVNYFYSAVNLLPVLPFDGGQVMAAALGPERRKLTVTLSLIFGLVIAGFFWRFDRPFWALLFAMSAVLTFVNARRAIGLRLVSPEVLDDVLRRARQALDEGDYDRAYAMARAVFEAAPASDMRRRALEISTWVAVMTNNAAEARALLRDLPPGESLDPLLVGAVHEVDADHEKAAGVLRSARHDGDRRPELSAALVRALLKSSHFEEACALSVEELESLDSADARRVASEALNAGRAEAAAQLFSRLFQLAGQTLDALDAARAFLRAGKRGPALEVLAQATRTGSVDVPGLRADQELAPLLAHPDLEAALAAQGTTRS
jgi:Zn-dependent protease